jgi:hypothetical protein
VLDIGRDERHQNAVDQVIVRHRDELNASIRRARAEIGRGIQSSRTIDDIISDGRKRHGVG